MIKKTPENWTKPQRYDRCSAGHEESIPHCLTSMAGRTIGVLSKHAVKFFFHGANLIVPKKKTW
jgi:hypothetical protein